MHQLSIDDELIMKYFRQWLEPTAVFQPGRSPVNNQRSTNF